MNQKTPFSVLNKSFIDPNFSEYTVFFLLLKNKINDNYNNVKEG